MARRTIQLTDALYSYIQHISVRESETLQQLREATAALPNSNMQISADQGQFMAMLIKLMGARRVLEAGVFTGYSTLAVAEALPDEGVIVACDVSIEFTTMAKKYWEAAGIAHKIDLRIAPALETLDALIADGQAGTYDFAFIDADKINYSNYYERCLALMRPGGLIAVDNVLWDGEIINEKMQDVNTLAIRALNEKLSADERIDLSLIPIGDGLTLARKR